MSLTWRSDSAPPQPRITAAGWLRAAARGAAIAAVLGGGLVALFAVRAVEAPLHGAARPWTPRIVHRVCRIVLRLLGLRHRVQGRPMRGPGAVVANHASWLDIFALNAAMPVTFVSKSEVARWPGIGFIARAAGTRFISREARAAADHRGLLADTLRAGHRPLFFPEGTSTDGRRVLPFRTPLFGSLYGPGLEGAAVQPATVRYRAPPGADPRLYGWWGDMEFGAHALAVLAHAPQGTVTVILHPPLAVAEFADRKALAAACERAVRQGLEA